jgi:hypothetical protein
MKNHIIRFFIFSTFSLFYFYTFSQNVGIGTTTPSGKLHVKGAGDVPQLIIDANSTQGSANPLIKLRNSAGGDLMWIHSDDTSNIFIGLKAGRVNVIGPQGVNNTFLGSRAGYSNTNGRVNTAIGNNAMYSNTNASLNTAIGTNALYSQSFSPPRAWGSSGSVAMG